MSNREILSELGEFINTEILKQPDYQIEPDEALLSSGVIDSFSLVDLALFIEDSWGVRIEDTELNMDTFDTLNELVTLIQSRGS